MNARSRVTPDFSAPAIEIEDVDFAYGAVPVLEGVRLTIGQGEFWGLVGPNGGGKSTLLKLMLGLLRPDRGRIRVLGLPPEQGRLEVGYVPQFATFRRDFPVLVRAVVAMGRLGRAPLVGPWRARNRAVVDRALLEAEAVELAHRPVGSLSGGQLQRVLVARALATEPRILLLDEPTANIDQRGERDVFDLLRKLNERLTIVVVSHDIGFISQYVGHVACLNRTLLCHTTDALTPQALERLYGGPVRAIAHHPGSASG
jgi:zinc transport system ATP-binding protein